MSPFAAVAADIGGSAVSQVFAHNEAIRNRKWMEQMSNTAHQREVEDLRKAGLNPILSAMKGGGASTPGAPAAPTQDFSGAGKTAIAASTAKWANRLAQEQTFKVASDTALTNTLIGKEKSTAKGIELENIRRESELKALTGEYSLREMQNSIDKKMLMLDNTLKRLGQGTSAIGNIFPKFQIQTKPGTFNPKTTGTFNKKTGEIHD